MDLARYLAGRARSLYPLSQPATAAELRDACHARGIRVLCDPDQEAAGAHLCGAVPAIILRDLSAPAPCAHEIAHAWIRENSDLGISYDPWEWEGGPEEEAADRFAADLTGESS